MIILLIITKNLSCILLSCKFEVKFINYTEFTKTEYFSNTSIVNMKNHLIYHTYHVISGGRKFSHISKMKIKTISNMSFRKYKYYLNQPIKMIKYD